MNKLLFQQDSNKKRNMSAWQRAVRALFVMLLLAFATGCGGTESVPLLLPCESSVSFTSTASYVWNAESVMPEISLLSQHYCVPPVASDYSLVGSSLTPEGFDAAAGFLFNISENQVYFSYNCDKKIYPASTTKLLTALTMLRELQRQERSLDEVVTIRRTNGGINIYGAKLCGFTEGDQVSLKDLLNALLVYSGNDAGIAIAEAVSGSVEDFVLTMNETAAAIGATHTHFVNPHGLHNSEHYTTAYDMYLIFRSCLEYECFLPIVGQKSYTVYYTGKAGEDKQLELETTNQYFLDNFYAPDGVTVSGGKTGSTSYAGDCFVMYSSYGNRNFISAVFGADSKNALYQQMTGLLNLELSDNNTK